MSEVPHSVAYLARFNSNPGPNHWKALKHVFRYVQGTVDHKLTYQGNLATNNSASHGDCVDTGRFTAGYTLSTTETEYMAAVEAGKEIAWMKNILSEFGYGVQQASMDPQDGTKALSQFPRILNIIVV